jgi:hypothetical protein
MTGKERILAALAGEKPDRVPFVPNIWQWFDVNDFNDTLPEELQGAKNAVEALRRMGADVFSKFDSGWPVPGYHTCRHSCGTPPGSMAD